MRLGFPLLLGLVLAAGMAALAAETEGFRVVTSEGARRLAVAERPVALPDVALIDQNGATFSLRNYRGRTVLVDFIYTRCPSLCGVLGGDFGRILAAVPGRAAEIDLLSISFDRQNDDQAALRLYGERYGATAPRWRVAVPETARGLARLLRSFGVVVVPDGIGGFVHDSDVYLVDRQGRLVRILDPATEPQRLTALLRTAAR